VTEPAAPPAVARPAHTPTTATAYGTPRLGADGPMSDDVMKCRLKRLSRSDYGAIAFTDAQWAQLEAAFGTETWRAPGTLA
jgi:hypothetical protein